MKPDAPDDPLARWRAHFSIETQRRGEAYARAGRVLAVEHHGDWVEAKVEGEDLYEVEADLDSKRLDDCWCACRAFQDHGPCKHLWAVLLVVLGGVQPRGPDAPGGAPHSPLRSWLEQQRFFDQVAPASRDATARDASDARIEYVLVLDVRSSKAVTLVETRRAKRLARGGFGKASPFALLAPGDVALGAPDRRLAALLRGAGTDFLAGRFVTRQQNRYALDAEQTELLLPELVATGRLLWKRAEHVSSRPLVLDEGGEWRPCMTLSARSDGLLELGARLERGAERLAAPAIRGILAGDFVVLEERIVRARLGAGGAWFLAAALAPPPPFTRQEAPEILLELARRELDAEPGVGLESLIAARSPTPRLTLAPPQYDDGRWTAVLGEVEFDYGVARVGADERRPLLPTGRGVLRRYPAVERALIERALALGASSADDGSLSVPMERVPELARALGAEGWIVEGEGAKWRTLATPRISVASGVDWFELEGSIEGAGKSAFPRLLAALRRGESTVLLDDGSRGIVPEAWARRWKAALLLGESHENALRFRAQQAWLVDLLLEEFVDRESQRLWEEQRERLRDFERLTPARESRRFRGELRPYQRDGLGWLEFLARQRFGGCLADDMGLGKTVQVLAWLQRRKERADAAGPALIVAPKSLTHNWLEEARRFTPELSALEYLGPERERDGRALAAHDLVLTTYGTVRVDVDFLRELPFGVVVLDEAQAIKNESSRTARSVRLLRAEQRLALSGTPIENHLSELWSLFEFLNPGMLGRSAAFRALLSTPSGGAPDEEVCALVRRAVRPFLLRRTKEEVLRDLPERSEQTVLCDMETAQAEEYAELRAHFRRTLLEKKSDDELGRDKLGILEMLLRLRQAACHPALLDPARAGESCAKFDAFLPMLDEVLESGHKALVFSQFTSFLALLRERLREAGREHAYLDGQTPAPERAAEVARFQQDPERKLFLISLKAGGTGLNLTAADYVFLLDPWWNPAVEAQAIGRSHRIGQERNVFAYRLVCRDTIEERVLELQAKKRELAAAILGGDGVAVRDLTREDLEQLLS